MWVKSQCEGLVNLTFAVRIAIDADPQGRPSLTAFFPCEDANSATCREVHLSTSTFFPDQKRLLTALEFALKNGLRYFSVHNADFAPTKNGSVEGRAA